MRSSSTSPPREEEMPLSPSREAMSRPLESQVRRLGVGNRRLETQAGDQRSLPEYDWLKDLLQSGKSGTMFLSSA